MKMKMAPRRVNIRGRDQTLRRFDVTQDTTCLEDGCDLPARTRGRCQKHYQAAWSAGLQPITPEERFWPKVDKNGPVSEYAPHLGYCWLWLGVHRGGYGLFSNRRSMNAHCFAYELLIGPIPEGLELDHLCRNRGCVNPYHLEPVTHAENCRRGVAAELNAARYALLTHCANGHPRTPENGHRDKISNKWRCKVCNRERMAAARAARYRQGDSVGQLTLSP